MPISKKGINSNSHNKIPNSSATSLTSTSHLTNQNVPKMPNPPIPGPDPLSNLPLLTQTLTSLTPALEILNRFHHRNRNQHRLSKWYSHLDMLRRHLRKFLVAVETRLSEVERMSKKKRSREEKGGEEVKERARWIRGVLVRGAYL
jgi:hypothetical protein